MPDLMPLLGGRPALTVVLQEFTNLAASQNGEAFFLAAGLRFVGFQFTLLAGAGVLGDVFRQRLQYRLSDSETWFDVAAFSQWDATALPPLPDRELYQSDGSEASTGVTNNNSLIVQSAAGSNKFAFIGCALPQFRGRANVASGTWSGRLLGFLSVDTPRLRYGRTRQWRQRLDA